MVVRMGRKEAWWIGGTILGVLLLVGVIVYFGGILQEVVPSVAYPVQAAEQASWDPLLNELQSPKSVDSCGDRLYQCGSRISFADRTSVLTGFQDFSSTSAGCGYLTIKQGTQTLYTGSCNADNHPVADYQHPFFTVRQGMNMPVGQVIIELKKQFVTGQILSNPAYFFEDTTNIVKVNVQSEFASTARLVAWVQGIEEGYDLTKKEVLLQKGNNTFEFDLPKQLRSAELYRFVIVPVHTQPFRTGELRFQADCPRNRQDVVQKGNTGGFCNGDSYAKYGDPVIMNFQVQVRDWAIRNPSEACPVGFAPEAPDSELCRNVKYAGQGCLDDNVKCPLTVCPKDVYSKGGILICKAGDRVGYECGVNGICSIPVFKVSEPEACRDQGKVYDAVSGTCVSAVYSDLTCEKDSECIAGCPQVTMACIAGRCAASGSCEPPTVNETRTITPPPITLPVEPPRRSNVQLYWLFGIIGGIVFIGALMLLLLIVRKKRRRR